LAQHGLYLSPTRYGFFALTAVTPVTIPFSRRGTSPAAMQLASSIPAVPNPLTGCPGAGAGPTPRHGLESFGAVNHGSRSSHRGLRGNFMINPMDRCLDGLLATVPYRHALDDYPVRRAVLAAMVEALGQLRVSAHRLEG